MLFFKNIILFSLFVYFFLYLPTRTFFGISDDIKNKDNLSSIGIYLSFGLISVVLIAIISGFAIGNYLGIWLIPMLTITYIYSSKKFKFFSKKKNLIYLSKHEIKITILIIFSVILQNIVLFRGGWVQSSNTVFPSIHDTMWNLALTNELFNHFPPQHPGIVGVALKNNHFFYPLFLAIARQITHINSLDLYFRFGPVLVSLLFGFSLYTFSTLLFKDYFFKGLTVFIGYFSGNISYLAPLLFKNIIDWQGNTFFSDQPFDQIINPYSVLGFSIFLNAIYLFSKYQDAFKKNMIKYLVLSGTLIGSLYGFKSFGGVIIIIALISTSVIYLISKKRNKIILITAFSTLIFIPVLFFTTDISISHLSWSPGWLLRQMMSSQDKLNYQSIVEKEVYYEQIGNTWGLLKIKVIEFIIYLIGNLGTRIIGLGYLVYILLFNKKNIYKERITQILILMCIFFSLFIPILFNLGGNAFNIIQFTPYSLILLSILTVAFSLEIYKYFLRKDGASYGKLTIFLIIALSIPVNIKNIIGKLEMPKDSISNNEISALAYLKNNSGKNDIVLINPNQYDIDAMYIPALSERRVYLASAGYANQTLVDVTDRKEGVDNFFDKLTQKNFLVDKNIAFIYMKNNNDKDNFKINIEKLNTKVVYENNDVSIVKILK